MGNFGGSSEDRDERKTSSYSDQFNRNYKVKGGKVKKKNIIDKGIDFVKKQIKKICSIMDVSGPNELREKLIYLANKIDIKIKLSDLNICINELSTVMELNQERLKNNPKKIIDTNLSQFFIE